MVAILGGLAHGRSTSANVFHKEMDCRKYQKQIQQEFWNNNGISKWQTEGLYRVFYSPKLDSCLAAEYILYRNQHADEARDISNEKLVIIDLLSGKEMWTDFLEPSVTHAETYQRLDNRIREQHLEDGKAQNVKSAQ
jgi:hypothetical protein